MRSVLIVAAVAAIVVIYSCSGGSSEGTPKGNKKGGKGKGDTMSLTTMIESGQTIWFEINANEEDRENVWIDLNTNGVKDEGEEVTVFGESAEYTVASPTITVYGKITKFSCGSRKISALDITGNPALEVLKCGQNMIAELDVTKNPSLKELFCQYNKITSLDLSKNKALRKMNISQNGMKEVTAKEFPELEYMELSQNSLGKEALTSLFKAFPARAEEGYSSTGSVLVAEPGASKEQNEVTPELVQMLKDKKWKPLQREGGKNIDL